ncbi:MAG TPA: glycosyltransferase family 4 protein [Polyangiaceae bacterium]|nr:glycosyltransferase family 4 protein [Polyangiaceae bacterium]
MKTIALLYRDHTEPFAGGAVHGYHVVEQLKRLGFRLITAERNSDQRLERYPRTAAGMRALLRDADAIYVRCDARPWDLALLLLNRASEHRPVLTEINAIAEERLAYGQGPFNRARTRVLRGYYHNIARLSDAAVCVSHQLASFVRSTYPIADERVHVATNGGVVSHLARPERVDGRFRVVWAGGARWPWQALDLVVESVRLLRERVPEAELYLYADSAPKTLKSEPGIVVEQPVAHAEIARVLSGMDAALCLYRAMPWSPAGFYNSPLKLFDYLGAGLPVVGSNLGQIAEVIADEQGGLLVGDDPREVATALERLARDPEFRARLSAAAHVRLSAAYTWNHTGDRIAAILSALLSSGGATSDHGHTAVA